MTRALSGLALCTLALAGCGGSGDPSARPRTATRATAASAPTQSAATQPSPPKPPPPKPLHAPFAVGERVVTFVDHSRSVRFPGGAPEPRRLTTVIRYPALGPPSHVDARGASPARAAGPFPLVIFGHGFAVTPAPYAPLLQAWARAGYVVAAPVFPLENADAPGGPNEADLVNQPRDMSFLITQLRAAGHGQTGFLRQMVGRAVAVTGQSDGGETALATAYDYKFVDRRVDAVVILSGAEIPGVGGFTFPAPSPPLLATQGTADSINPPSFTHAFYDIAPRPKFLLTMFGASHLGPYTGEQPQLRIVARVSIDFLNHYLKLQARALQRMARAGDVPGISVLAAEP